MRMIIGLLAALSVGALSHALAAEPPPADAAKSATQASSTANAAPTAASAPAATTEPAAANKSAATNADGTKRVRLIAGDAEADARIKKLKAAGYKPEMRNGEVVFCRREAVLGSRFEKKVCSTAEQLDAQAANGQDVADSVQRSNLSVNPSGR